VILFPCFKSVHNHNQHTDSAGSAITISTTQIILKLQIWEREKQLMATAHIHIAAPGTEVQSPVSEQAGVDAGF
jgi:cytosine/adenosine deaminase-related metal-dependent hydrolase